MPQRASQFPQIGCLDFYHGILVFETSKPFNLRTRFVQEKGWVSITRKIINHLRTRDHTQPARNQGKQTRKIVLP